MEIARGLFVQWWFRRRHCLMFHSVSSHQWEARYPNRKEQSNNQPMEEKEKINNQQKLRDVNRQPTSQPNVPWPWCIVDSIEWLVSAPNEVADGLKWLWSCLNTTFLLLLLCLWNKLKKYKRMKRPWLPDPRLHAYYTYNIVEGYAQPRTQIYNTYTYA